MYTIIFDTCSQQDNVASETKIAAVARSILSDSGKVRPINGRAWSRGRMRQRPADWSRTPDIKGRSRSFHQRKQHHSIEHHSFLPLSTSVPPDILLC